MSVYKGDRPDFLCEALESLCIQTLVASEIVLVIDGPIADELYQVILDYKILLPLKIIKLRKNRGLAYALNKGLRLVSHEIIFRFDSDDVCAVDRFERQLKFFVDNNCDLVGSQIYEFDVSPADCSRLRVVPCDERGIYARAKWRNPFNHMSVVFKKSKILQVGGYPSIPFMEDYALWIKLISNGCKVKNMTDTLVFVRAGESLIRRRSGLKYIFSEFLLQRFMYRIRFIGFIEALLHFLIRSSLFLLPYALKKFIYLNFLRKLN